MSRTLQLFTALLMQAGPVAAGACETEPDPAVVEQVESVERLFRFTHEYDRTPAERRDAFRIVYRVATETENDLAAICVVVREDGAERVWPRDEGGRLQPALPGATESDGIVIVRGGAGEARVEAVFEPAMPLTERMDAGDLARAAAQASQVVKSAHGLVGLAAPGFTSIRFEWDGPAPLARMEYADGRTAPLEVIYDRAWFQPGRDRQERRAEALVFGRAPIRAVLAP